MRLLRKCTVSLIVSGCLGAFGLALLESPSIASAQIVGRVAASRSVAAPGPKAAVESVIVCTLSIDYPHESSHVPGTANVESNWSCTAPVASLSMNVGLIFDHFDLTAEGSFSNAGLASLQGNAASDCFPGEYNGTSNGSVVFPPGYEPSPQSSAVESPDTFLTCTG